MGEALADPCIHQSSLERRIVECIGQDPQEAVRRAYQHWNQRLRGRLINVTGLRLKKENITRSVPIHVVSGLPAAFADILEVDEASFNWWIEDHHVALARASDTLKEIIRNHPDIQRIGYENRLPSASLKDLGNVVQLVGDILTWQKGNDWLGRLKDIREDVFGAYFYWEPNIEIYWIPIALVAKRMDVGIENMTVVVLTHELAHAYTHLGFDTDGDSWDTDSFARASEFVVEGLAQFYTERILEDLISSDPGPYKAFEKLVERQSPPYTEYRNWVNGHSRVHEVVRLSMLEARIKKITDYEGFKRELESASGQLPHDPGFIPPPVHCRE